VKGSEDADADDVSDSRAETLPLRSRLQTVEQSSQVHRSIAVDDLWTYLAHQKTVGYRDLKAEYEVCVSKLCSSITRQNFLLPVVFDGRMLSHLQGSIAVMSCACQSVED